jgi:hypothetical protein
MKFHQTLRSNELERRLKPTFEQRQGLQLLLVSRPISGRSLTSLLFLLEGSLCKGVDSVDEGRLWRNVTGARRGAVVMVGAPAA